MWRPFFFEGKNIINQRLIVNIYSTVSLKKNKNKNYSTVSNRNIYLLEVTFSVLPSLILDF